MRTWEITLLILCFLVRSSERMRNYELRYLAKSDCRCHSNTAASAKIWAKVPLQPQKATNQWEESGMQITEKGETEVGCNLIKSKKQSNHGSKIPTCKANGTSAYFPIFSFSFIRFNNPNLNVFVRTRDKMFIQLSSIDHE